MDTESRLARIEALLSQLIQSDRYTIHKTMQIFDGRNIQLGTTTGSKIGTAVTQKIGFFNASPVSQQSAITTPTGGGSTDGDAIDVTARVAISQIKTGLKNLGLTA